MFRKKVVTITVAVTFLISLIVRLNYDRFREQKGGKNKRLTYNETKGPVKILQIIVE